MRFTLIVACVALLWLGPFSANAAILYINPEGSGDEPTIQAACNAAENGDEIVLADGVYGGPGNRAISIPFKQLTLRSESNDPEACVIDCEDAGSDHQVGLNFFSTAGYSGTAVNGLKIKNAYNYNPSDPVKGGAVYLAQGASPFFENCIFEGNSASGAAVYSRSGLADPLFLNCIFRDNQGVVLHMSARGRLEGCTFEGNSGGLGVIAFLGDKDLSFIDCRIASNSGTSGFYCSSGYYRSEFLRCEFFDNDMESIIELYTTADIDDCSFSNNQITFSIVSCHYSTGSTNIRGCTFARNDLGTGFAIKIPSGGSLNLSRNIIAFNDDGASISNYLNDPIINVDCCNVIGNSAGDWIGKISEYAGINGNISEDPQFCGPEGNNFHLQSDSPCAPDNNECGVLIGALPVGCDETTTRSIGWSFLKSLY